MSCRAQSHAAKYIHYKRNVDPNKKELKYYARYRFKNLIDSGKIIRPTKCSSCEVGCSPDAHHPNYNKPNEVQWLCRRCHSKLHHGHIIKAKIEVYEWCI
jgi:hypothetical protein